MKKIISKYDDILLNNGNKANNIAILLKNGINAPKTWIINYKYLMNVFKKELNIDLNFKQSDYSKIYEYLNNVPKKIYNEVLNEIIKLKDENKNIKRFAIRSSHVYEDGIKFSFSGLFQTELNLSNSINITNAIFHCWRDCFKNEIQDYSKKSKIKKIIPCSIIIQEFVITEVSGVAFRDNNTIYINSTFGMAKSIVDGETGYDSWKLDSKSKKILEYENTKNTINIPLFTKTNPRVGEEIPFFTDLNNKLIVNSFNNQENFVIASLNDIMCNTKSLNETQINSLISIFEDVSKKLDIYNYDIEWGIRNNEIFIFQCRSLTRELISTTKTNYTYLPLVGGETIGRAYFVENELDAKNFPNNSIIIAKNLSGPVLLATSKAIGCILESKSPLSHSAIIARELGIPAVGAVKRNEIVNGSVYKINGTNGTIELLNDEFDNLIKRTKRKVAINKTNKSKLFLDFINQYNS